MKIKGIVIPADMDIQPHVIEFDRGDIRAMQRVVGGLLDVVDTELPPASVWVNDEGLLETLDLNLRATMFVWAGESVFRNQQHFVGDVLVTGLPDKRGNTTGVSDDLIKLIFHTTLYKTQVQTHDDDKHWSGNSVTYSNYWEALYNVLYLSTRWTLVKEVRVVAV